MSYKGVGLFTSSPLSAPPSSTRKPVASTSRVLLEDSEEDEVDFTDNGDDNEDGEDDGEETSGLAEGEFDVEAILARRGGYNGKTLMYKIRWAGFGPDADTWEPRENISANDLIDNFERKHLVPQKEKRFKDKDKGKKVKTPSIIQSKKSHSTVSTSQIRNIALAKAPARRSRDKSEKPLFWREPLPYIADELVIPVSSLVADAAWSRIRSYINNTRDQPRGSRKLAVIHPATLVRLRTITPSSKLNTYFRVAVKETAQLIKESHLVMFGNGAFPQRSRFCDAALDDVIVGGESFQLSWPYGIEEPDQEVLHIIAALQHMPARLGSRTRCRLLVRNVETNLKKACDYFNVDVIDAKSFIKRL